MDKSKYYNLSMASAVAVLALGIWLFLGAGAVCAGTAKEGTSYRLYGLSGDEVRYVGDLAEATGHVRLVYGQLEIYADSLESNLAEGWIVATGNVMIVERDRRLKSDYLSYDIGTESGELQEARGDFGGVYLQAKALELSKSRVNAREAKVTTCDRESPHFLIEAEKAVLLLREAEGGMIPERLEVHRAKLRLYGKRMITLPTFSISLTKDPARARTLPLPYPGYSKADGIFFGYSLGKDWPERRLQAVLAWRSTAKRGLRGRLEARYLFENGDDVLLVMSRRDDPAERRLGPRDLDTGQAEVLVNREPEIIYTTSRRPLGDSVGWQLSGTAGHYREQPTGVSAGRRAIIGRLMLGPFAIGEETSLSGAAAYRWADYDGGDEAGTSYGRITLDKALSDKSDFSLSLVERQATGNTPFQFDKSEIEREVAGELGIRLDDRWKVYLLERYDLQEKRTRDFGVNLSYRAHCLEYSLGWRENRGLFEFGVSIVEPQTGSKAPAK